MAARVELLRGVVGEAVSSSSRVGFEETGRPSAIALDLAIQAAGACAVPLPAGLAGGELDAALAARDCSFLARFEPRAGEAPPSPAAVPAVLVPRRELPEREAPTPASAAWAAGSVLVADGGGFAELPPAELLAAAGAFAGRLAAARPRSREILVLPRPLHHSAGRLLAAWSLLAGAALVLEPDPGHLVRSAVWVRPTVFAGDVAEISALRAAVGESRGRGLPLRRLHTLAVVGRADRAAPLPEEDRRFWAGRGTAVTVV